MLLIKLGCNKISSADVGQAQELVTQQTFSVQEMEYLLFGNKMDGELSFKNLTDAGKGVINTMLVMKKWYNGKFNKRILKFDNF